MIDVSARLSHITTANSADSAERKFHSWIREYFYIQEHNRQFYFCIPIFIAIITNWEHFLTDLCLLSCCHLSLQFQDIYFQDNYFIKLITDAYYLRLHELHILR